MTRDRERGGCAVRSDVATGILAAGDEAGAAAALGDEEARALVSVVTGLAEDLGVVCAIAVLDPRGAVQVAVRAGGLSGEALDAAIAAARRAIADPDGPIAATDAVGVALLGADGVRGALGVSGGPEGFGSEACRHARGALGFA